MRVKLLIILTGALVLFEVQPVHPAGPGTTAANFLKIGAGARASGMGEAFTALADDATSSYWNPAGLARIKEKELSATYNLWFQEIKQGYLGAALPLKKGTLGLTLNYVDLGTLEGRDEAGNPTGNFRASDFHLSLGYGRIISQKLSLGLTLGWLQDRIEESKETTFLGNLGLLYLLNEKLTLGMVAQNLGSELADDPLPLALKVGFSYRYKNLILAADLVQPQDNDSYFCLGTEYQIGDRFSLRLGYKTNQDVGSGFTAGAGFKAGKFDLDYAYVPYGELGESHRVSLGIRFGK